jgi:beta-lactamase class A
MAVSRSTGSIVRTLTPIGRRAFVGGAGAALLAARMARADDHDFAKSVAAIEAEIGGRIGIAVRDTGTRATLAYRPDERFAMASTFKLSLAACVLAGVDAGAFTLDQMVPYTRADLLPHAPVTEANVGQGGLSLAALLAAIVEVSDNGAANLLLKLCGGPEGLTRFLRRVGDRETRIDRMELDLNQNLPGDPRDTTTPAAMAATMQTLLLGDALSVASRQRLIGWLRECKTGSGRLRAGLPSGWSAGDKTGTGDNGAVNDLLIGWPPAAGAPILIACYMSGSTAKMERLEAAQARIGALAAAALA